MSVPVRWSPIPQGESFVPGEFQRGPGYKTYRPNGTGDWQVMVVMNGSGTFRVREKSLVVDPGDVVVIRPGACNDYGTSEGCALWRVEWVHFQPREEWLALFDWPEVLPGILLLHLTTPLGITQVPRCLQSLNETYATEWQRRRRMGDCLLEQLFLLFSHECELTVNPDANAKFNEILSLIASDMRCELGRDELAERFGMSPTHLSRIFKVRMGLSIPEYREHIRIERAAVLLDTTARSIADIADELGYADQFYFSNRFKRVKQLSPRAWRARRVGGQGVGEEPVEIGFNGWVLADGQRLPADQPPVGEPVPTPRFLEEAAPQPHVLDVKVTT